LILLNVIKSTLLRRSLEIVKVREILGVFVESIVDLEDSKDFLVEEILEMNQLWIQNIF
jgi:hypothetical protein